MVVRISDSSEMSSSASSSSKEIQRLLDILRIEGKLKGAPGFCHALHVNYERLNPDRFHIEQQTLTFRFPLSSQLSLDIKHEKVTSLAMFMALADEVSTWALILANPQRPPHPGISTVSVQMESGPVQHHLQPGSWIEILASLLSNVQQRRRRRRDNLGFVQVELREICSGEMICFGTLIKKWISSSAAADGLSITNALLLSPFCGWPLLKFYSRTLPEPLPSTFRLQDLFDSLDHQSHTQALFTANESHSGFTISATTTTMMHSGCQAMVMEMVGRQVAKHELAAPSVHVDMAQISYPSSPPAKKMEVHATLLSFQPPFVTLRIKLRRVDDGEVMSEGLFRFINAFHRPKSGGGGGDYHSATSSPRYDSASWDTPTTKHAKNVFIYSVDRSSVS